MATKKAASTAKKSVTSKPAPAKKQATTTTKVTTVKAVESKPAKAATVRGPQRFNLNGSSLLPAMIAEFVGTFLLAAIFIAGQGQPILIMFGLIGIVLAVGSLSGGYANPALVIGAWATKRMNGVRAAGYIIAQVLGAMLALVLLNAFVNAAAPAAGAAAQDIYNAAPSLFTAAKIPEAHHWMILLSEVVGSIIFGFAAASALTRKADRSASALTMGLGMFLGLMVGGSAAALLGASAILNPAVAISLQAISFDSVWPILVYVIGALAGGVAGFFLYDYLRKAEGAQTV
ncbi:MAG: aquaporin [Candidatus Saccharimonadales bacterium]